MLGPGKESQGRDKAVPLQEGEKHLWRSRPQNPGSTKNLWVNQIITKYPHTKAYMPQFLLPNAMYLSTKIYKTWENNRKNMIWRDKTHNRSRLRYETEF